eukprot:TRINITY_DN11615_c0_g1::TRINITY_DN11615_c0_g1_i1::g.22077::m.22077 TRINITY_DN11615_c0_g1::TRINITY_DN11615_c0_g1_i1::g.22077  ORF type:complete len:425 (+),score=19.30,sp/Q99816/TS101_HUMAN/31.34/2e-52,UEV/PF05743.8/5.7e-35,Vps23_core/PF09454.5/4e-21,UQ_con/PF00179.21/0.0008,UQ_con/PF00179.21/1.5e+04,HrpB7/PF09486.5/0.072,GCN5L1/PF06320.8/1.4 TRINITY_DN11615_c0_g1_i1:67-1341(+)
MSYSTIDEQLNTVQYRERWRVRDDVFNAIRTYHGLQSQIDNFVQNNVQYRLLCLRGTIPILHAAHQYNIPLVIWIHQNYPHSPPMVYVTPTANMMIQQHHRHVDMTGFVYHPYLSSWNAQTSNLVGLISILCNIFGSEPPVYSRPAQQQQDAARFIQFPANPYPPPGAQALPYQTPLSLSPAQMPPHSTPYPYSTPSSNYNQPSSAYPSYMPNGSSPSEVSASASPSVTCPPVISGSPSATAGSAAPLTSDQVLRKQYLSRTEEKVRALVVAEVEKLTHALDNAFDTQAKLATANTQIQSDIKALQQEKDALQRNEDILLKETHDVEDWVRAHEDHPRGDTDACDPFHPDRALAPANPLMAQYLECTAQDEAINDTIFLLNTALSKGSIDLASFLKEVRALSREQFFSRTIVHRAKERLNVRTV